MLHGGHIKRTMSLTSHFAALIFLVSSFKPLEASIGGNKECPEAKSIQPCTCINSVLECTNIYEPHILERVFQNSVGHSYYEVHLKNSVLQYIPADIFENVTVQNIYLFDTTLISFFDYPANYLDEVDKIHIENSHITRPDWSVLEPLKNLRLLTVYMTKIRRLEEDFGEGMPSSLQQISFYGTKTLSLTEGLFQKFTKLDKVAIDAAELTILKRSYFPVPFNARVIYFNDNKLTYIPDDLFTQMPNLQTVGLRSNKLSVIPASAFDGRASTITYVMLDDNPLECDCELAWLVKDKPKVLSGTCSSPTELYGKDLKDLSATDMCR